MFRIWSIGKGLTTGSRTLGEVSGMFMELRGPHGESLLGKHIPKDFRPEDTVDSGGNLVGCCGEDDESREVVFD